MPLTLTIRNASQLDNGSPIALVLDRRGATIGRSATSDWCLPDPALHISSRHCEVRYADNRYELIDHSTNGTFMLGEAARLGEPRTIGQGDVFVIGRYEVEASLDDAAAAAAAQRNAAPQMAQWQGWGAAGGGQPAPLPEPEPSSGWGATPAAMPPPPAGDNWGAAGQGQSQGWSPEPSTPPAHSSAAPSPAGGGWGAPPPQHEAVRSPGVGSWPAPPSAGADQGRPSTWGPPPSPPPPASGWSSPIENSAPPATPDIWGKFAASNVVDWARGGFGSVPAAAPPPPSPAPAPFASHAMQPPPLSGAPQPEAAPQAPAQPTAQPIAPAPAPAVSAALAGAAGIDPGQLQAGDGELLAAAGNLLRRLVSGMVVMLEARARAKSQMGAQGTSLEFDGNNPLKFARTPEQALVQLLNPPERGFMASDRAIEDAFKDLQAHQMATLMAMQGALRATLERFSPAAIRARAETGGLMSRILPAARDQALWNAYEKEFSGVAKDSDEAFMDMFAKEFRRAYEDIARKS